MQPAPSPPFKGRSCTTTPASVTPMALTSTTSPLRWASAAFAHASCVAAGVGGGCCFCACCWASEVAALGRTSCGGGAAAPAAAAGSALELDACKRGGPATTPRCGASAQSTPPHTACCSCFVLRGTDPDYRAFTPPTLAMQRRCASGQQEGAFHTKWFCTTHHHTYVSGNPRAYAQGMEPVKSWTRVLSPQVPRGAQACLPCGPGFNNSFFLVTCSGGRVWLPRLQLLVHQSNHALMLRYAGAQCRERAQVVVGWGQGT